VKEGIVFNRKRLRLLVRNFHENGLKLLLENSGNVREVLQILEVRLLPRIDFAQMRVVPGRFVQRDYRHLESDLVLQVPLLPQQGGKLRRILLYILIEHQSEPDHLMPLRALDYVVMIYKRQMREWLQGHANLDHLRLQPVLPIVLYTGTRTWDKLIAIWELVELGDEMKELIPEFQPLFLNVGRTSREILGQRGGVFGMLLRLLQQRRARLKVFEEMLREVVRALEALAETDRQRWLELLSYLDALLYYERGPDEHPLLQQTVFDAVQNDRHRQEVYDMGKTMAEYLKEEGEAVGLRKGEVRARQQWLVDLLRTKFGKLPASVVKRIETTDRSELLDAWFHEALDASKLAELSLTAD
jgi:hypothetical protein